MAKILIVNARDEVIGAKERGTETAREIYRVAALWIINSKNELLLARRAFTKSHSPGQWGPAAAGTVEDGETYESNIIKEAGEELGLNNIQPIKIVKVFRPNPPHPHFTQQFLLKLDLDSGQFKMQASEVAEVKWFASDELKKQLHKNPHEFLASIAEFKKILNYARHLFGTK